MAGEDRDGLLDSLLSPLMLPRRAAQDLEALGQTARSLPEFERELMAGLYDLVRELSGMRVEVRESLQAIQGSLDGLAGELKATQGMVTEVRDQVADLVEHIPDLDARGPNRSRARCDRRKRITGGDVRSAGPTGLLKARNGHTDVSQSRKERHARRT